MLYRGRGRRSSAVDMGSGHWRVIMLCMLYSVQIPVTAAAWSWCGGPTIRSWKLQVRALVIVEVLLGMYSYLQMSPPHSSLQSESPNQWRETLPTTSSQVEKKNGGLKPGSARAHAPPRSCGLSVPRIDDSPATGTLQLGGWGSGRVLGPSPLARPSFSFR